jgi:hypothetical protein
VCLGVYVRVTDGATMPCTPDQSVVEVHSAGLLLPKPAHTKPKKSPTHPFTHTHTTHTHKHLQVEQTPAFVGARELFVSPEIQDPATFQFKWTVNYGGEMRWMVPISLSVSLCVCVCGGAVSWCCFMWV